MANAQKGFTLLELMITLAVLVIGIAIAIPSFRGVLQSNRMTSQSNEMLTALQLARSEAVNLRRSVSICPTNVNAFNAASPNCSDNWLEGWMIFVDTANPGSNSPAIGDVIRVSSRPRQDATLTVNSATDFLRFLPNGRLDDVVLPSPPSGNQPRPTLAFNMTIPNCIGDAARNIEVAPTGRTGVVRVQCE